jgi:hypothetical protein
MPSPDQARLLVTFADLPLQEAIRQLFVDPDFVRSEALLISDRGREWILQKIIANLPHDLVGTYRFEHILLSVSQQLTITFSSFGPQFMNDLTAARTASTLRCMPSLRRWRCRIPIRAA